MPADAFVSDIIWMRIESALDGIEREREENPQTETAHACHPCQSKAVYALRHDHVRDQEIEGFRAIQNLQRSR
jgi:hypothetical protein